MKKVTNDTRVPIKMWLDDCEDSAIEQIKNAANLPFVFRHVALMPDAHKGYSVPIGSVVATKGVILPGCVGVDIACGMAVFKTSLTEIDTESIKKLLGGSKFYKGGIRTSIPVGPSRHSKKQDNELMPSIDSFSNDPEYDLPIVLKEYESARKQLGTLGGGNHFWELQKGNDGFIWVMVHSGSRNLGYKVANHYTELSKKMNKLWYSDIPEKSGLNFFPLDSHEGHCYFTEMSYCARFALNNRLLMLQRTQEELLKLFPSVSFGEVFDVAHNYARMENHFGANVMIHRKGATSARLGELGIIPGSQGTKSYIVRGKGNQESFSSCSHGAGRVMSRTKARENLDLEEEIKKMDDLGIVHGIRDISNLDESSSAYKDISVVMDNQSDLVDVEVELTPLAVMKG